MNTELFERIKKEQKALCVKYGAECLIPDLASKLGISEMALEGELPIHGLRHTPKGGTSGWFIWSGTYSEDADFFQPLHVDHAISDSMPFAQFLGLAPGWRFLIGEDGYEDVWFDPTLLENL